MRRYSLLFVVLAVFMVMFAPAALAAPPQGVEISVDVDIASITGDFTAAGPAVDSGDMCPAGVANGAYVSGFAERPWFTTFVVDYTLTCDDGSGDLFLRLRVWLDRDTGETFALWRATGGTGDYVGLRGTGWLIGTPTIPDVSIEDVYTGWLRF